MEILTFTNYKSFIKRIVMPQIYGKVIKIRRKIENLKDFSELLKQIPYNSEKGYVISVSNMRIEMNKGYYSLTFKDFRMTYKDENDIEIENFSFPVMAEIAEKLPFKKCVELKLADSEDGFSVCSPGWICFAENETLLSSCLNKMSKVKEICDANGYRTTGTINWNIVNSVTYLPEENKINVSLPEYSREDFDEIYKFKKAHKELKIVII